MDPRYVNPVKLPFRLTPGYSPFEDVDSEAEITDAPPSTSEPLSTSEPHSPDQRRPDNDGESVSSHSVNRTTVTKTVSTSSTINRVQTETSKTSKDEKKDESRFSHENRNRYEDEYDYEDYPERRYDHTNVGRDRSRTHSRVSRRVYTSRTDTRDRSDPFGDDDNNGDPGTENRRWPDRGTDGDRLDDREGSGNTVSSSRSTYSRTVTSGGNRIEDNEVSSETPQGLWRDNDSGFRVGSTRTGSDPDSSDRRSGWSSSSKTTKTSRTYTSSGTDQTPSGTRFEDRGRYDGPGQPVDRMGLADPDEEGGSGHYESNTFDGGRGRETRRWGSKSSSDPDGASKREKWDEYNRVHSTVEGSPDTDAGVRNSTYSERSRKTYTSRVSSSSSSDDRDGADTESDRHGNVDRTYEDRNRYDSSGTRASDRHRERNFDERNRYSNTVDSSERNRNIDSTGREFDSGYDSARTNAQFSPEWNDRNTDVSRTEYSRRVQTSRVSTASSDANDERTDGNADSIYRREHSGGSTYESDRNRYGSRNTDDQNRERDGHQGTRSGSDSGYRRYDNNDVDGPSSRGRGSEDSTSYRSQSSHSSQSRFGTVVPEDNSISYSNRRTYSPYDDSSSRDRSRSYSSSSRTYSSSSSADSDPRSETRWQSGGFRSGISSSSGHESGDSKHGGSSRQVNSISSGHESGDSRQGGRSWRENSISSGHESRDSRHGGSSRQENSISSGHESGDSRHGGSSWRENSISSSDGRHETHQYDNHSAGRRYDQDRDGTHTGDDRRQSWSSSTQRRSSGSAASTVHADSNNDVDSYSDDDYEYEDYDYGTDSDGSDGLTYTKTVIDGKTGEAKVYSRRVYNDGFTTEWKEVDGPPPSLTSSSSTTSSSSRSWSSSNNNNNNGELRHSLRRVKREKEMIVQPEAYTDDQTGRTLQVVNLVSISLFCKI